MADLPAPAPELGLEKAWRLPADRNPALVYLAHLAPGSRRTMRGALDTIAGILSGGGLDAEGFPWHRLRYQHTQAVRTLLMERYRPATANKMLAALRGVLREAWRLGLTDAESYHRASDLGPVRGEGLPRGRSLGQGELRALFDACGDDPAGLRDQACLAVLYGLGLRRSEAARLDLEDWNQETGELRVREGKGRKGRVVWTSEEVAETLRAWLGVRGTEPGPLFCPVRKGGRVELRRMTDQAIYLALRKRAAQAGVARFSPHDLRRSFISDLLDAGADISTVQRLAGHANVQTTARYDRRGEETKRRAVRLLHIPAR